MKRSGFKPKSYQRPPRAPLVPVTSCNSGPVEREPVQVAKDAPVRSEAYRRYVASLPCWRCGVAGRSQAAHGDEGKGMGIKSSDLTCWPACGPFGGLPGCHYIVGTSGLFTREYRREIEKQAAMETQALLVDMSGGDPALRAVLVKVGLL